MNGKNRILVCINDSTLALQIKIFLEGKGFYVFEPISTGDELIREALNHYPTLIISDITLKGEIDGIEAISRLSGIMKVPYIFITDSKEDISLIKSYYLNPVEIFTKPVELEKLNFLLTNYIDIEENAQHSDYYLG